jgi:O-antigen/teichoic acid export membrane protein
MPQRLKQGTIYMVVGLGISMAIGYITQVLASRSLGPEVYGQYGLVLANVAIIAGLIDPGLSAAMATFIAEREVKAGRSGVRCMINTGLYIELSLTVIVVLVVILFFKPITTRFFLGKSFLTIFFLILVVIQGFYGLLAGVLQGLRELLGLAIVRIVEQSTLFVILFVLITLSLLKLNRILTIQVISDSSALTLSIILIAIYLARLVSPVDSKETGFQPWTNDIPTVVKFGAPVSAAAFATSLIQSSGPALLNYFTNNNPGNQIGLLVVILTLARVLDRILTTIFRSAFPYLVHWNTQGKTSKTKQYTDYMAMFMIGAYIVLFFGSLVFGRSLVSFVYGNDYIGVATHLPLAILAFSASTLRDIYKVSLFSFKVPGAYLLINFLGTIFYILMLIAGKYLINIQDIVNLIFISMGASNLLITLGSIGLFNRKMNQNLTKILSPDIEG